MPDEHDNQPASNDKSASSPAEMTAAQRRAQAMAKGGEATTDEKAPAPQGRQRRKRKKKEKKKYDSILGYLWGEWIRPLGQILVIVMTFRLVAVDWFDVPSGSMEPTVLVGDRILVHKWVYGIRVPFSKESWIVRWGSVPSRGDIVVCYSPDQGDEVRLVKRLVAQPGDTIAMENGRLIINGVPSEYTEADANISKFLDPTEASKHDFYIEATEGDEHAVMFNMSPDARVVRNLPPIVVPDDQYVVIGDNRFGSKDSRDWNLSEAERGQKLGFMPVNRIQGRAFAVAFSLDKSNYYLPRITRTGKPLD